MITHSVGFASLCLQLMFPLPLIISGYRIENASLLINRISQLVIDQSFLISWWLIYLYPCTFLFLISTLVALLTATEHPFKTILTTLPKPGGGEYGKFYSLPALNDPRIGNCSACILFFYFFLFFFTLVCTQLPT